MGRPGRAPDPRSIHRNPLAEWTEVSEVPFDFESAGRRLPAREWHEDTRRWYRVVASLPHATLWRDGDWMAIFDLALLKQKQYQGAASASEIVEIRQRENALGLTEEARYKNRIRYVPATEPTSATEAEPEAAATGTDPVVTPIASARDRLRSRR